MAEDIIDILVTNYNDNVTLELDPAVTVINISNLSGLTGIIIPSGTVGLLPYYDTTTTFADSNIFTNGNTVGINNTTPTLYSTNKGLVIRNDVGNSELLLQHDGNTAASIQGLSISTVKTDAAYIFQRENLPLKFGTNNLARGRFNAAGYLKISPDDSYAIPTGTQHEIRQPLSSNIIFLANTHPSLPYGPVISFPNASPNNGTYYFITAMDSTTTRFQVNTNGGISNYQANDTNLSDKRVKHDIVPMGTYWNSFKKAEFVKYKYKDQTHDDYNLGAIADQILEVLPEVVDVEGFGKVPTDGIPLKSIYEADFTYITRKVLQEAMLKIEELENKILSLS